METVLELRPKTDPECESVPLMCDHVPAEGVTYCRDWVPPSGTIGIPA
jgi:hypothetical protein